MYFTREDYKKILKWLLSNAIKDTEFDLAVTPLQGEETVVFVLNGQNVRVYLKDLAEQLIILGGSDLVNVSSKYNAYLISLAQAISYIPYMSRLLGQLITFNDTDNNWRVFQFRGERVNQWNNTTLWIDIIQGGTGKSVVPDEEDLTWTELGPNMVLKFKDRTYNPNDFSGLGMKILRKNIVLGVNILQLTDINQENTIYEIRYDFDLMGQTITIPVNSVLNFTGGSLKNGSIIGSNTFINNNDSLIFKEVTLLGTWGNDLFQAEWFGAVGDGVFDNTITLNNILSNLKNLGGGSLILGNGIYRITDTLYIGQQVSIIGYSNNNSYLELINNKKSTIYADFNNDTSWIIDADTYINEEKTQRLLYNGRTTYALKYYQLCGGITLRNLNIQGNSEKTVFGGIRLYNSYHSQVTRCNISNVLWGLATGYSWDIEFSNIQIDSKLYGVVGLGVQTINYYLGVRLFNTSRYEGNEIFFNDKYLFSSLLDIFPDSNITDVQMNNYKRLSMGFAMLDSTCNFVNCTTEWYDIGLYTYNGRLMFSMWYVEGILKSLSMARSSRISINRMLGSVKETIPPEQLANRWVDYYDDSASVYNLEYVKSGELRSNRTAYLNTYTDNTKIFTIVTDNPDKDGWDFNSNYNYIQWQYTSAIIFINDVTGKDTNFGFSRSTPITWSSFIKRVLDSNYNYGMNIYTNKLYYVLIDSPILIFEGTITSGDFIIDGNNNTVTAAGGIAVVNSSVSIKNITVDINNKDSLFKLVINSIRTVILMNNVTITNPSSSYFSLIDIYYDSISNLDLSIKSCTLPQISSVSNYNLISYYTPDRTTKSVVTINFLDNNIDLSYKNNWRIRTTIPSLVNPAIESKDDIDFLTGVIGYYTYDKSYGKGILWDGSQWLNLDGSLTSKVKWV